LHSVPTQTQLTSSCHKQGKQQKKRTEEERLLFDGHVRRMEGRQLPGPAGRRRRDRSRRIWSDDLTVLMRERGVSEEDAENRERQKLGARKP
jgi:hypothetical protein